MNLTKILKVGDNIYCTLFGNMTVANIYTSTIRVENKIHSLSFDSNGRYSKNGECLLFPSKDNRDWSTWETKKKCPFKPFDKVLVRDVSSGTWYVDLFGHFDNDTFSCIGGTWCKCIPYNKDTQHLVGTNQDCPDKYKIW